VVGTVEGRQVRGREPTLHPGARKHGRAGVSAVDGKVVAVSPSPIRSRNDPEAVRRCTPRASARHALGRFAQDREAVGRQLGIDEVIAEVLPSRNRRR